MRELIMVGIGPTVMPGHPYGRHRWDQACRWPRDGGVAPTGPHRFIDVHGARWHLVAACAAWQGRERYDCEAQPPADHRPFVSVLESERLNGCREPASANNSSIYSLRARTRPLLAL